MQKTEEEKLTISKNRHLLIATCLMMLISFSTVARAKEPIVFAVGEWAPFIGQNLPGYGPVGRLTTAACQEAGLTVEFEFLPWSRSLTLVKKGRRIATLPWAKRKELSQGFHLSQVPLFASRKMIYFVKEKYPGGINASTLEQLRGYNIVGIQSYWYEKEAELIGLDMHLVPSAQNAWKLLVTGRKDVFIENDLVAMADMKTFIPDDMSGIGQSNTPINQANMFILFSRVHPDAEHLKARLDKALVKFYDNGEIERIMGNQPGD